MFYCFSFFEIKKRVVSELLLALQNACGIADISLKSLSFRTGLLYSLKKIKKIMFLIFFFLKKIQSKKRYFIDFMSNV